jgi:hypothetical protein
VIGTFLVILYDLVSFLPVCLVCKTSGIACRHLQAMNIVVAWAVDIPQLAQSVQRLSGVRVLLARRDFSPVLYDFLPLWFPKLSFVLYGFPTYVLCCMVSQLKLSSVRFLDLSPVCSVLYGFQT